MSQMNVAARRFYGAFYRWTQLTSSSHAASGQRPRCRFHHESPCDDEHSYFAGFDGQHNIVAESSRERPVVISGSKQFSSENDQAQGQPSSTSGSRGQACPLTGGDFNQGPCNFQSSQQPTSLLQKKNTITKARDNPSSLRGSPHSRSRRHLRAIHIGSAERPALLEAADYLPSGVNNDNASHAHTPDLNVREDVRAALRLLTHPVVVVTSSDLSQNSQSLPDRLLSCRGVTVSSFTTVTLHPTPIISFNVKVPSRSWDAIQNSQNLRIHLMDATAQGASIAHTFTQPYEHPHEPFQRLLERGVQILISPAPSSPLIAASDGVLAHLSARILQDKCIHVGDHVIVVAEVLKCQFLQQGQHMSATELGTLLESASGLAYAAKGYRTPGEQIRLPDHAQAPSVAKAAGESAQQAKESGALPQHISTTAPPTSQSARAPLNSQTRHNPFSTSGMRSQFSKLSIQHNRSFATFSFSGDAAAAEDAPNDELADTLEPSARVRTVADLFNIPNNTEPREAHRPTHLPRIRHLLLIEAKTRKATERLQAGVSATGDALTAEEVADLETRIAAGDRKVAKHLARAATRSLRIMLDNGRVDFSRARWLEGCIEQGHAAVLAEMALVRDFVKQGRIMAEGGERMLHNLRSLQDMYVSETSRLRQLVEEENDDAAFDDEFQ